MFCCGTNNKNIKSNNHKTADIKDDDLESDQINFYNEIQTKQQFVDCDYKKYKSFAELAKENVNNQQLDATCPQNIRTIINVQNVTTNQ